MKSRTDFRKTVETGVDPRWTYSHGRNWCGSTSFCSYIKQ